LPSNVVDTAQVTTYTSASLYKSRPAPADTKLTFNPPITNIKSDGFTYSFDCYLDGTYRSTTVPRVISYFGDSKVTLTQNSDLREYTGDLQETPRFLTVDNTDILSVFTKTNFIIYADPVKNDLKVGIFTLDKTDPAKKYLELASIIPNIPINQPFQITMILGRTYVEVYMNKKLISTYTIGSLSPNGATLNSGGVPTVSNGFYTPISFIGDSIKIGNVQYFDGTLTSGQVRDLTNVLQTPTFFR
jgi:hypothetical protein